MARHIRTELGILKLKDVWKLFFWKNDRHKISLSTSIPVDIIILSLFSGNHWAWKRCENGFPNYVAAMKRENFYRWRGKCFSCVGTLSNDWLPPSHSSSSRTGAKFSHLFYRLLCICTKVDHILKSKFEVFTPKKEKTRIHHNSKLLVEEVKVAKKTFPSVYQCCSMAPCVNDIYIRFKCNRDDDDVSSSECGENLRFHFIPPFHSRGVNISTAAAATKSGRWWRKRRKKKSWKFLHGEHSHSLSCNRCSTWSVYCWNCKVVKLQFSMFNSLSLISTSRVEGWKKMLLKNFPTNCEFSFH